MNIAHLLPYSAKFPLTKHNGRYEWALRLASLQAARGDSVTIYAAPDSYADNPVITWTSLPRSYGSKAENNRALFTHALEQPAHDVYHSHFDALHYALPTDKPVIYTQHWFPSRELADSAHTAQNKRVLAVPVTHYMKRIDESLGIPATDTIHHGIDIQFFTPSYTPRTDRLLFYGRITPQKGVLETVKAVRTAHEKLDIIGKINEADAAYWEQIKPLVDGTTIRYLGPKTQAEIIPILGQAKAFIFLPQQAEAFGQVIVEAQACGAPVIIQDIGANQELIRDTITGLLVRTEAECIDAMKRISSLNPHDCRVFAEQFDQETMLDAYDRLYHQLTAGKQSS